MSDTRPAPSRILVGLGNPGADYGPTRHNVGFRVVEEVARRRGIDLGTRECNALVGHDRAVTLVLPQTYMNRSGYAVRCLRERQALQPEDLLVIYDEVHLPLGKLRLRGHGSPAGHRGMESVIENLGTDRVPRLRLGVAPEEGEPSGEALVDFVLAPFAAEEQEAVTAMIERGADACELWLAEGLEAAMQRFNG